MMLPNDVYDAVYKLDKCPTCGTKICVTVGDEEAGCKHDWGRWAAAYNPKHSLYAYQKRYCKSCGIAKIKKIGIARDDA